MSEWITRKITKKILNIFNNRADKKTYIFYITSAGGEGKTILLRQIGKELGSIDGIKHHDPWSGILDLYHSNVHTNSALEGLLIDAFHTTGQFSKFKELRAIFTRKRKSGMLGVELETLRTQMSLIFADCMNLAAQNHRLAVAFDTTERLQFEIDEVQMQYGIQDERATVRDWLLQQLELWKNCVILLVGRPEKHPYLASALEKAFQNIPDIVYEHLELGGFDSEEAENYFAQKRTILSAPKILDIEFCSRLIEVTQSSPIRLELAFEIILNGLGLDRFREDVLHAPLENVREKIDRLLIDNVIRDEQNKVLRELLRYLAFTKRGLSEELAFHLANGSMDKKQVKSGLRELSKRFYVKNHPDDNKFFLHDEMYQLLDKNWLNPDDVQEYSNRIANWYTCPGGKIELARDETVKREYEIESIWYMLRADPVSGYHVYAEKTDSAIRSAEVGFELKLKNEIIAFFSPGFIDKQILDAFKNLPTEYKADATANLVKRLMVRGKNDDAVDVGKKALSQKELWDISLETILARWDLFVQYSQAKIYSGNILEGIEDLDDLIRDLERGQKPQELAAEQTGTYQGRKRNLILGRAHNNLGYAHWGGGHLISAIAELKSALPYFNASGLKEEMANTYDNMARVYATLGHETRAKKLVQQGLDIRKKGKLTYREALSLVSKSIVFLEFDRPENALLLSTRALDKFEKLDSWRGRGLAYNAQGRALRALAKNNELDINERIGLLNRAIEVFRKAIDVFGTNASKVREPVRLIEAKNELGCSLRDLAFITENDAAGQNKLSGTIQDAIGILEETIQLSHTHRFAVWEVDTDEDLAQIYIHLKEYDKAERYIRQLESTIPSEYFIHSEIKSEQNEIPETERVELFWAMLGKAETLRADIHLARTGQIISRENFETALEHYMLAAAYFEKFAGTSDRGLKRTFGYIFDKMQKLGYTDLVYFSNRIPEVAGKYNLDVAHLIKFYEDTFGIEVEGLG